MTERQAVHEMMVQPNHDEMARQEFCQGMRAHLLDEVQAGTQTVFEARVRPAFKKEHGRDIEDRHDIRRAMTPDPYYRLFCASLRGTQELMWDSVIDSVERELPRLKAEFKRRSAEAKGSLTLDPDLEIPRYHTAADIHLQPGAYHTDVTDDDVSAGAIFERAVYMYGDGKFGANNDFMGHTILGYLTQAHPEFRPDKVLDMGCTTGNSTLPYVDAFPAAEVYAVDVGAPCLRYAHARAEALSTPVHFSQQNAEHTSFEDATFDLIVSHILFHETSRKAFKNILGECHRLLRPGGLMLHLDIPQDRHCEDRFNSFLWDWEAYHNNETFCVAMRDMDYEKESVTAGFDPGKVSIGETPFGWPILVGEK